MTKKLLIPLLILGVILATGLGLYIASSQSAQPSSTQQTAQTNDLRIKEINKTLVPTKELGKLSYTANDTQLLIYSDTYEKLGNCAGKQLGELQLSETQTGSAIPLENAQYKYATFIPQPMGECGGDEGKALADALSFVIANAR